jgi:predicted negative regulator of RcsB-dependent stress response
MDPIEEARRLAGKLAQGRKELAQGRVGFIQTELRLALTFLDVADTTRARQTRERNIENAQKARDEVQHLLRQGLACTQEERAQIEHGLATLNARLAEGTQPPMAGRRTAE